MFVQAHYVYGQVGEAKDLVDHMAEENREELAKVKESLDQTDTTAQAEPQEKTEGKTDSQA